MSRTLIVGTSYVQGAAAVETLRMWARLTRRLNPGVDFLVVDAASPEPLLGEVTDFMFVERFDDNVGHLAKGGRDGWGRAFTHGIQVAIHNGYDWLVFIEIDLLFAKPVAPIIAFMERHDLNCAAPMALPFPWTETALSFYRVRWLDEFDLAGKYDWETSPVTPFPEQRIDRLCEGEMVGLPLKGCRWRDLTQFNSQAGALFTDGMDWITHADLPVLRGFLKMNGLEDV